MMNFVREGDLVVTESISRFARNTKDLLGLVEQLHQKKVGFVSQKESIDTDTPAGKFMLTVFGAVAELEREYIRQRQKEGIEAAKRQGKYKGRPAKELKGFVAAMNLEFAGNRNDLIFEKEYNLNTKPLEIDLLVIKKEASVQIENEIGTFFQGHNIMEYKSPKDHLDIDAFYKSMGYACLYKSYGKTLDGRKADDITLTLVREVKPEGLFQYFETHGYPISNPYKGIYHIGGKALFPTQIVVTKELDKSEHIWLKALSEKLEKQDMQELIGRIRRLSERQDKEFADSVFQVSIGANQQIMEVGNCETNVKLDAQ